jgi:hypothetical protein
LPTETRLALAYRFKELEAQKAKERQGARNDLVDDVYLLANLSSVKVIHNLITQQQGRNFLATH